MPSINLASQRMNTGGDPGGLRPVAIDGRVGASMRAPSINVNAGNVRYSKMVENEIVPDKTISQAAEAGMSMVGSAMEYQERVDTADANQRILEFDEKAAQITNDYLSSSGQEAVSSFHSKAEAIRALSAGSLEGASPAVRAKMVSKVHTIASDYTGKSSMHRSKQQTVWEQNIQSNAMAQDRSKMLASSNDQVEFTTQLDESLASVDAFYVGQPELAEQAKRALTEDAYLSAARQQSDLGNFALATDYLESGMGRGVDPAKSAASLKQIEGALFTSNNRKASQESSDAADYKRQTEAINHNYLQTAMDSGDRSKLASIVDPTVQIKYEKLFDDFMLGRPSDDGAEEVLQQLAKTSTGNPDDVLTHELPIYVSAADRKKLHTRLLSDRKLNITQQRKQSEDYVDTMIQLPADIVKPTAATAMDTEIEEYAILARSVKDQKAYWNSRFDQALADSKDNPSENAETAVLRVKAEMLTDMEAQGLTRQNVSRVRIPVEAIRPIKKMFLQTGGMIGLVRLQESGDAVPRIEVEQQYQDATLDLMRKYGLDLTDPNSLAATLAADPILRKEALRDVYQLNLQKQYLIQNASPSRMPNAK